MLAPDPQLSSAEVMVHYLSAFQRFLTATIAYNLDGDKAGMLLVGHLAGTLRILPAMLWHGDDYYHSPPIMNRWLEAAPKSIEGLAAPERLAQDCQRILAAEGVTATLGLRADLVDLELAPLPAMRAYLDLLYHACLCIMPMTAHGTRPSALRRIAYKVLAISYMKVTGEYYYSRLMRFTPWKSLERAWTVEAQSNADANRRIAEVLLPVPQALVKWSTFDEEQFRKTVFGAVNGQSNRERLLWNGFVNGWDADLNDWKTLAREEGQ